MTSSTCRAKNPRSCRYHGVVLAMEDAVNNSDIKAYETLNAKLKTLEHEKEMKAVGAPSPTTPKVSRIVKVYRAGSMTPPVTHRSGEVQELTEYADKYKPAGVQGRSGAVFASPLSSGLSRWVLGNSGIRGTTQEAHEIKVDPETVYVYDIHQWEGFSWGRHRSEEAKATAATNYWKSGVTLKEWLQTHEEKELNGDNWELLLSRDDVISSRSMSDREVVINAPESRKTSLMWVFAPKLASKGKVWQKRQPKPAASAPQA